MIDDTLKNLVPTDPQRELEAAVDCAAARAPEDYTTYYLLRGILVGIIRLFKLIDERFPPVL